MEPKHNIIAFPVGTQVRVRRDYRDSSPLRQLVLTVQHHSAGDADVANTEEFIDNHLYTEAMQYVGPFANWELEIHNESN